MITLTDRVLAQCSADHDGAPVTLVKTDSGYGRHVCDAACQVPCYRACDDSDLIVEVEYGTQGYRAVYGILDGRISLWMD